MRGNFALFCLVGLLCAGVLWLVYDAGYSAAESKGKLALSKLEKEHLEDTATRWAEYAAKERASRQKLHKETEYANALEAELLQAKNTLAKERKGFAQRIAHATANNACVLSADVVRLYNEALYGPNFTATGTRADSANYPASSQGSSNTPAPLDGGLLQQPVTIQDLLAHAKDYGEWAREIHGIALGWNTLEQSWQGR